MGMEQRAWSYQFVKISQLEIGGTYGRNKTVQNCKTSS